MNLVEVWYVRMADVTRDALLRASDEILAADERERARSFRFDCDRHQYLVTRALGRGLLGRRLGVHPSALTFRRNAFGRPELDPPGNLRFNLTNTTSLVACAVATGREVGVDAEPSAHADAILEVALSVFTGSERQRMALLAGAARRARAVHLWTAKEAYIKARGLGLSLAPATFELDFGDDAIELRFGDDLGDHPGRWEILTREIEGHVIAVCTERLGPARGEVVMRRACLASLLGPSAQTAGLTGVSTMQPSPR